MSTSRAILAGLFLIAGATSVWAGEPEADKKLIKRIFVEVDLVPSLYAMNEKPVKFNSLPKFSAKKLTDYWFGKKEIFAKDRDIWKENKEQYAKDFPLRAAIFEAAAEVYEIRQLKLPLTLETAALPPGVLQDGKVRFPAMLPSQAGCVCGIGAFAVHPFDPVGAKAKAVLVQMQEPLGKAVFRLEAVHARMKEAAEQRDKEKSKRWLASFDFALARVQSDLIFLFEYNYALGQIRADKLPDLGPGDDGWKIAFQPKVTVTEQKAKVLAKERKKLLERIQKEYPETPWAYFAERESSRALGMVWTAKKK